MNFANYADYGSARAYQDLLENRAGMVKRRSRHGPFHRIRSTIANSLVLTGAKLMPETPAVVGNRVLVFDRSAAEAAEELEFRPAA